MTNDKEQLDCFGKPLRPGDLVMRRRRCEHGDQFKCHPASFGVVRRFVTEGVYTRPELADNDATDEESWTETQVDPHDKRMQPLGEDVIQWAPAECIKISKPMYAALVLAWPLIRLLHGQPLDGRSTDW